MVPTTPTGIPPQFIAGDSVRWRIPDSPDYPQSENWVLHYRLVGKSVIAGGAGDLTAVWQSSGADANFWLLTLATTVTAAIVAGRYRLIGRFVGSGTYAGREESISDDVVVVLPDPRTAAAGDFQTQAEKMLAFIDLEIAARVTGTGSAHESYQVDGRALNKVPLHELHRLRGKYAARVYREKTGRVGERVAVDFTRQGRSSPSSLGNGWVGNVD